MQQIQPLFTIEDLAKVLRRAPASLHSDLSRNPASVPPPIRIPGARRLLWDPAKVQDWLAGFATVPAPAKEEKTNRRRGRPTKAEQIAAERAGRGQR